MPIRPQYVARVLDQVVANNAVSTCDLGTSTARAARYLTMNGRHRLIGSLWHGSMANALTQAMGAQAGDPAAR